MAEKLTIHVDGRALAVRALRQAAHDALRRSGGKGGRHGSKKGKRGYDRRARNERRGGW